ncbi:MAG: glycoside hydrolase [Actinomycetota bacterium]|nr:glycoside hydrolase [Actinomycetota bacterium]
MTILVGTGSGLHRVEDGHSELEGRAITALAGDWALVDGKAVWRDGHWVGGDVEGPDATCLLPLDDGVLLGTTEGHLVRQPGGERVASFEDAPGRDRWYTPWGGPADVRSLAAAPDGTLYVNVHVGGILRSTDGGATWEPTLDIDLDVHQVVVSEDGTVLAATARGLAVSNDAGHTWTVVDDGLPATYARAVAVAGDTVLLSASTGPAGGRAAVYRRPLRGGAPFRRSSIGLPSTLPGNVDTFCLVADGERAVVGTFAGRVYASDDAGASWSTVAAGPPVTCLSLI